MSVVGGYIHLKIDGELYKAKGSFTYNMGMAKRETVAGQSGIAGYKLVPQESFVEGSITDDLQIDLKKLFGAKGATVTLELANQKSIILRDAWYSGSGEVTTEEGEVNIKFSSAFEAEEIR